MRCQWNVLGVPFDRLEFLECGGYMLGLEKFRVREVAVSVCIILLQDLVHSRWKEMRSPYYKNVATQCLGNRGLLSGDYLLF